MRSRVESKAQPIGFLVMAAGQSTRFGKRCKLTAALEGSTVLDRVLCQIQQACTDYCHATFTNPKNTAASASTPPIYVVTNRHQTKVHNVAAQYQAKVIFLPTVSAGLGYSLARGVMAASHWRGWIMCLGDMPWIPSSIYYEVLQRAYAMSRLKKYTGNEGLQIAPSYNGRRVHPVFFSQHYYDALRVLKKDKGAASVITNTLHTFNAGDADTFKDIDTPQDIDAFKTLI